MILSISGPSSTGKTTLINDLYKNGNVLKSLTGTENVVKVEETARGLFTEHFGKKYPSFEELLKNGADTMEFEFIVARDQIHKYAKYAQDNTTLYLCDRCPLDTMVYLALNYQYANQKVRESYSSRYQSMLTNLKDCYDRSASQMRVYKTLPFSDESIEDDGFRPMQYVYRRQAELLAFDLLTTDLLILPSDRQERVQVVLDNLVIERIGQ